MKARLTTLIASLAVVALVGAGCQSGSSGRAGNTGTGSDPTVVVNGVGGAYDVQGNFISGHYGAGGAFIPATPPPTRPPSTTTTQVPPCAYQGGC